MPNSLHMDVHPNDGRGFGPSSNFHFRWLNRHFCRFKTAFDCQRAFLIPCRTVWFKPPSTALADSPPLRGQSSRTSRLGTKDWSASLFFFLFFYHFLSFYLSIIIYLASYLSKWFKMHIICHHMSQDYPRLSYSTAKNVVSLHCWHFPPNLEISQAWIQKAIASPNSAVWLRQETELAKDLCKLFGSLHTCLQVHVLFCLVLFGSCAVYTCPCKCKGRIHST